MNRRHRYAVIAIVLILVAGGAYLAGPLLLQIVRGPRTVADVVAKYGPAARARLAPHFARAKVAYPPKEIALLVLKSERRTADFATRRLRRSRIAFMPGLPGIYCQPMDR